MLPTLPLDRQRWIVVDPPRVGLHPDAARFLATQDAEALVYVACNPASLGRDRAILEEGGWKMTELWSVDLFPQTPHVEAVARFVPRTGAP
ncbi:MAG: 23S rRNA (uracil1939-C5)-methyltransferase [Myxococcota bacterium]